MTMTILNAALIVCLAAAPEKAETPRKPNPFAPSLPQLSDEEEEKLDQVIDRFIQFDIGQLKGEEGKKALAEFQKLGPEAAFALIRGLNRAAQIESSCPAVIIGKKLSSILKATNDVELLEFARENVGLGVERSRHLGVIKDLRATALFRKNDVARQGIAFKKNVIEVNTPRTMSVAELAKAAEKAQGDSLKPILIELEKRSGDPVIIALALAATSYETETRRLGRELLASHLGKQKEAFLKQKLKDDRAEVRELAAQVVGTKKLRLGSELIELLADGEEEVRQAAREALVKLSGGPDFGPDRNAGETTRAAAVFKWREWWTKQGK